MADGHDHAVVRFSVDAKTIGQRCALDDQRVIARRLHRRRASREQPLAAVPHLGHFAVHRLRAARHARAERLAERLVAEAHAEERDVVVEADQIEDAPGARRRAGAGRDDDRVGLACEQRRRLEAVVADDIEPRAGKALDLLH